MVWRRSEEVVFIANHTVAFEDRATYVQRNQDPIDHADIQYQKSNRRNAYSVTVVVTIAPKPNAEYANVSAHSKSSYSSRSCMKLFTAIKACLRVSWSTSRPSLDMPSLPTLTRPSILDRPGRQAFAIRQRLLVELMDGHDDEISLLSRRTVRALRTFRKILHRHGQRLH